MNKTKFFSMRLPPDIWEQLKEEAAKADRTVAGQVLYFIRQGLATK